MTFSSIVGTHKSIGGDKKYMKGTRVFLYPQSSSGVVKSAEEGLGRETARAVSFSRNMKRQETGAQQGR